MPFKVGLNKHKINPLIATDEIIPESSEKSVPNLIKIKSHLAVALTDGALEYREALDLAEDDALDVFLAAVDEEDGGNEDLGEASILILS